MTSSRLFLVCKMNQMVMIRSAPHLETNWRVHKNTTTSCLFILPQSQVLTAFASIAFLTEMSQGCLYEKLFVCRWFTFDLGDMSNCEGKGS